MGARFEAKKGGSAYHTTKDGRRVKKGLYYYMNKRKKAGTSRPGKGTVSSKALKDRLKLLKIIMASPAWQRKAGKNPSGGLNKKGVASYRRANPGSKLKTAVTTKPSKLKKDLKPLIVEKVFVREWAE